MPLDLRKTYGYTFDPPERDGAPIEDSLRWLRDIHAAFERHGIGRALWNDKQKDFGLVDPRLDGVRDELVKLL